MRPPSRAPNYPFCVSAESLLCAYVLVVLIVLVADAFQDFFASTKLPDHVPIPSFGEGSGIFDGLINVKVRQIRTSVTFAM